MSDENKVLDRVSEHVEILWDGDDVVSAAFACHLCPTVKQSRNPDRALYELAFHYERRHPGWTAT